MGELPKAHRALRDCAKKLEAEGVDQGSIVDALLWLGINSGIRRGGDEKMVKFLETAIQHIRSGTPLSPTRH